MPPYSMESCIKSSDETLQVHVGPACVLRYCGQAQQACEQLANIPRMEPSLSI